MTNLCGHDRDALSFALGLVHMSSLYAQNDPEVLAYRATRDPAKLAEMLAERGRELGLSIAIYDNHRRFRMSGAPVVYALLIVANGFSIMDRDRWGWDFDMPQTRTILLQWLQLPDGAREEAERVLHGNHADPDELINTIPMHERVEPRRFDPDPDRGRE